MDRNIAKRQALEARKFRVRKTVVGTPERPRLSVYRSEKHIYGQIIDDSSGRTLFAASTVTKDLRDRVKDLDPTAAAKAVGEALAAMAVGGGVTAVVFDRSGRRYGGRIKALADAARGKGLQF
jgi:large subunit ribosomal protein L18